MKWKTLSGGFLILFMLLMWWILGSSLKLSQRQSTVRFEPSPSMQETSSPVVAPRTSEPPVERRDAVARVMGALTTPIIFYGKIIDQNGAPVPDATVDYATIDKFDAEGSHYHNKSDSDGNFSISGIRGAVLTVGVSKAAYYNIHKKSDASFAYGVGVDSTRRQPPTKQRPAVFLLQKMGPTEPLVRVTRRQIDIPKSGAVMIDLGTGRQWHGNLRIESWIGDTSQRRFDWRFRLSIPDGGLIERNGRFDFEAPSDGYKPDMVIDEAADAQQWSSDIRKDYFAKLPDGRYARFDINFYPGQRNFVVLESYLNPQPGSRNLEYDPGKEIKAK